MNITEQEKLWLKTMGDRDEFDVSLDEGGKFIFLSDEKVYIPANVESMKFRTKNRKIPQTDLEKKQRQAVYFSKYYERNKEKMRERGRKYALEHPEMGKAYYEKHREELMAKILKRKIAKGWKPKTDFIYLHKICRHCKKEGIPLIKQNREDDRQYYACRECNTEICKKYRRTEKGRLNVQKASYKAIAKNPQKQNARASLNYHLKKGNITKPSVCEKCKEPKQLNGHHDDYNFPIRVRWLCRGCHADVHRELKLLTSK